MDSYPVGQTIPVEVTWYNVAGDPADPASVSLQVEEPDGTETTYTYPATLTKTGVGVYKRNVVLTEQGDWVFRFVGAGSGVDAVAPRVVRALPSELVSDAGLADYALVTLQETREYLRLEDTDDDLLLVGLINAASSAFVAQCGREIARTASVERTFGLDSFALQTGELRIGDAADVTAVEIDDRYGSLYGTVAAADWITLPENRRSWEPIRRVLFLGNATVVPTGIGYRVRVTGEFGFPEVPTFVRQAILEEVEARHGRDLEHRSELQQDNAPDVFSPSLAGEVRSLTRQAYDVAQLLRDPVVA